VASLGTYFGVERKHIVTAGCMALLVLSAINTRVNGFSPLSIGFEWPALTEHTVQAQRMLALIPADASVSAQDTLNSHLSDRAEIFLFPDYGDAEYLALDASADVIPSKPSALAHTVELLLRSRRWDVLFANDGLLLLHRRSTLRRTAPTLPTEFYSFALPIKPAIAHPLRATVTAGLELLGYTVTRKETVNLRLPNVVITTYWQVTAQQSRPLSILTNLTDEAGQVPQMNGEQTVVPWLPVTAWKVGQIVATSSTDYGITAQRSGTLQACISVVAGQKLGADPGTGLPIAVTTDTPSSGPYQLLFGNRVLCVGTIQVVM